MSNSNSTSTCSIPTDLFEDFDAPAFKNTAAIQWMHDVPPRYGRSKDILLLMEGTEDEQEDYIRGLLASSITMLCFFGVWMIILAIFHCMGPSQVGVLSGKPPNPTIPTPPRKLWFLRMLVLFAGLSIIISSILMSVNGVDSLTHSLNDGREAIGIVQNLTKGGIDIIDDVLKENEAISSEIDGFLSDTNRICPLVRDPICTDLNDVSTCNFEGIFDDDVLKTLLDHFAASERSVYYKELVMARDDLEDLLVAAETMDDKAKTFNWALWLAFVFSWVLSGLCLWIMVGVACRMPVILKCLQSCILVPSFCLLVVCSFVFSGVFVIGSMALADLCVDSPDPRIMVILNRFRDTLSPILVEFAVFYISQCPASKIPQELTDQIQFIVDAIPKISGFSSMIEDSAESIQVICGLDDPAKLIDVANTANAQLCDVAQVLKTVRLYFQCENWYPLYETTTYDAMCYSGTDGFAWVASTQFVVVFMAMIILTFRVVFYDDNDARDNNKNTAQVDNINAPTLTASAEDDGFEMTHHG